MGPVGFEPTWSPRRPADFKSAASASSATGPRQVYGTRSFAWGAVAVLVVLAEQVVAEVALPVAPHRVHVVGPVLRVVVLDDERRAGQAVIVAFVALIASDPCEADVLDAGGVDALEFSLGKFMPQCACVSLEQ